MSEAGQDWAQAGAAAERNPALSTFAAGGALLLWDRDAGEPGFANAAGHALLGGDSDGPEPAGADAPAAHAARRRPRIARGLPAGAAAADLRFRGDRDLRLHAAAAARWRGHPGDRRRRVGTAPPRDHRPATSPDVSPTQRRMRPPASRRSLRLPRDAAPHHAAHSLAERCGGPPHEAVAEYRRTGRPGSGNRPHRPQLDRADRPRADRPQRRPGGAVLDLRDLERP